MRHRFRRGAKPEPPVRRYIPANFNIKAPEVRVIGADGEQVGVMKTSDGIALAQQQGLDLVEIVPNAQPPVCKIVDLGKYLYHTSKEVQKRRRTRIRWRCAECDWECVFQGTTWKLKPRKSRNFWIAATR